MTESAFKIVQTVDVANFSPELRLPLQLIYNSSAENSGITGYGWRIPQLESSAGPERDGMTWTTQRGDNVWFYAKSKIDKDVLELYKRRRGTAIIFRRYAGLSSFSS